MLFRKKKQSQYTGKATNSATALQSSPSAVATSSSKYYRSITELPLCRFIDCVVDKNLYALIISGHPSLQELAVAWDDILLQYGDAMKDNEQRMFAMLRNETAKLSIVYDTIRELLDSLEKYYCQKHADAVNNLLHTHFKFDVRFPEDYDNDVKRARNRSKGMMLDIQLKQSALQAMHKRHEESKPMTRELFQSYLITLSDHVGYRLHDDMTVFEYADRIRRLNQIMEKKQREYGRR